MPPEDDIIEEIKHTHERKDSFEEEEKDSI